MASEIIQSKKLKNELKQRSHGIINAFFVQSLVIILILCLKVCVVFAALIMADYDRSQFNKGEIEELEKIAPNKISYEKLTKEPVQFEKVGCINGPSRKLKSIPRETFNCKNLIVLNINTCTTLASTTYKEETPDFGSCE